MATKTRSSSSFIPIPRLNTTRRWVATPSADREKSPLRTAQNNTGHERLARIFRDEALGLRGRQRRPMVVPHVSPIDEDLLVAAGGGGMHQGEEGDAEDDDNSMLLLYSPKE